MRRTAALLVAAALGVGGLATLAGSVAAAPCGGGGPAGQGPCVDPNGIGARVEVHLTGDVVAGVGSGGVVSVPPSCWWESFKSAADFLAYWDLDAAANHDHSYAFWGMPSREDAENAVKKEQETGKPITWYGFRCRDDLSYEEMLKLNKNPNQGFFGVPAIFQAIVNGDPVPAATISVEDLRDVAQKYTRLLEPTVVRAPAAGRPAIVQLPTWYWVDPDDVKTKLVRAEADGIFAEVRADSLGIEFASANASPSAVDCVDAAALVEWHDGMSEDATTCKLTFPQTTGLGGRYTVTATNTWFADWHSSDNPAFQPVPQQPAPQVTTTQLQVAETQVVGGR
jgi:hypothetical protein